jgi:hypothetical protein
MRSGDAIRVRLALPAGLAEAGDERHTTMGLCEKTADVNPLREGQRPVHVGVIGTQFGVEREFYLQRPSM